MQIKYTKTAQKYIEKLPRDIKQLIKKSIEGLAENPPKGDIKNMEGSKDGRKRLRVGKYRVIYKYENDTTVYILIMDVGSRGDIYK